MTVAETLLVFAGIPLAIIAVMALLIFWPRGRKRARYKSGQPWPHEPVWYEPHPEGPAGGHGTQVTHGASTTAVAAAPRGTGGPLGGARGTW